MFKDTKKGTTNSAVTLFEALLLSFDIPINEGTKDTPGRLYNYWLEMTKGLRESPPKITKFKSPKSKDLIVVKDLDFVSCCSHHFLPFFGKVHIGYIPDKFILGLSKFPRIVDHFAAKPQTQEQLTSDLAYYIRNKVGLKDFGIVIEAQHTCMIVRGVKKINHLTITSNMRGLFMSEPTVRSEFLDLTGVKHH